MVTPVTVVAAINNLRRREGRRSFMGDKKGVICSRTGILRLHPRQVKCFEQKNRFPPLLVGYRKYQYFVEELE